MLDELVVDRERNVQSHLSRIEREAPRGEREIDAVHRGAAGDRILDRRGQARCRRQRHAEVGDPAFEPAAADRRERDGQVLSDEGQRCADSLAERAAAGARQCDDDRPVGRGHRLACR